MRGPFQNLVLVGFASTGKTAVGRILAERLGFEFIDLDDRVEVLHIAERGVQRRCREIFGLFGRQCFIDYETRALAGLTDVRKAVIALGGGTPIDEANREKARELGGVVYLDASAEAIFERMKIKGFPLYLGDTPALENLSTLVSERAPIYESMADIIVNNTALSADGAANSILTSVVVRGLLPENLFPSSKDIAS